MSAIYAYVSGDTAKDVTRRINAKDHPHGFGDCCLCGGHVKSVFVNKVWQWQHVGRCNAKRKGRCRAS